MCFSKFWLSLSQRMEVRHFSACVFALLAPQDSTESCWQCRLSAPCLPLGWGASQAAN